MFTINYSKILTVALMIVAMAVTLSSTAGYQIGDSKGTLLVTESILLQKTIKLDHYGEEALNTYGYRINKKNNHYYYTFPLGTPIVSVPFVAMAEKFGFSMLSSELIVQKAIVAFVAVITLFFLIKLAGMFISPVNAVIFSGVFWFGTSWASTCGSTLWSHDFATLFALVAVYCSIQFAINKKFNLWPAITICLFFAYLCRPTMALLSPCILLFLFSYNRKIAIHSLLLIVLFFLVFVGFSFHEFHQLLPKYYFPQRLHGGHVFTALYGNLFSPARGLLIYSSFILIAWICYFNRASKKTWGLKWTWWLIGTIWPAMHLMSISSLPHWWGGWSFGPRFMTDALPGIFLLTLYAWPTTCDCFRKKMSIAILVAAAIFSIYVNSYQGLFNSYAVITWNASPNIDKNPEYLFNWEYPQFFYDKKNHEKRLIQHKSG